MYYVCVWNKIHGKTSVAMVAEIVSRHVEKAYLSFIRRQVTVERLSRLARWSGL